MKTTRTEDILLEWNPWWREVFLPKFIERDALKKIIEWNKRKEITTITGVRRSGKTTLMYLAIKELLRKTHKENVLYIKLDDNRLLEKKTQLLDEILNAYYEMKNPRGMVYVFLDEIQEVRGWERVLLRLYDQKRKIKFTVSGSNASVLKSDYSSALTGRVIQIEAFPLDFREFLRAKNVSFREGRNEAETYELNHAKAAELNHHLLEYIRFGGFPEVVLERNERMKDELLGSYFDSILYRDIINRKKIRKPKVLKYLLQFALSNVGCPINFTRVAKSLGVSTDTVGEYYDSAEEAYLTFVVPIFDWSVKRQQINPKKIYAVDTGLRNIFAFVFSEDIGRLAENLVFLKLLKLGREVYYWKDRKENEVDFLTKKRKVIKELINVCWEEAERTKERETKGLLSAMEEFGMKKALVVTKNRYDEERHGKKRITYRPLWLWLLTK